MFEWAIVLIASLCIVVSLITSQIIRLNKEKHHKDRINILRENLNIIVGTELLEYLTPKNHSSELEKLLIIYNAYIDFILKGDSNQVFQTWLKQPCPQLRDYSPAHVIRYQTPKEAKEQITNAVLAFLSQ